MEIISTTADCSALQYMKMVPLKVALLSIRGANSMASWRGVLRSLQHALGEAGAEVVSLEYVDRTPLLALFRFKQWFIRTVLRRKYQRHREPIVSRAYGAFFHDALIASGADIAISLKSLPLPYLDSPVPVILYNDAPFGALRDFYAEFTGLSAASIRNGEMLEQAAGRRAVHAIYSSDWGAGEARTRYGIPENRISVIDMGANFTVIPTSDEVRAMIDARAKNDEWVFFWLGVDWERKGGTTAIAIVAELRRRGIFARLEVAGVPNVVLRDYSFVRNLGFLAEDRIRHVLAHAHFLLLPTKADCTPIVYNEANSFGVPVISTDVGGVRTQIHAGINGILCDHGSSITTWADAIAPYLTNQPAYVNLAKQSRNEYETRLNWQVAATRILAVTKKILSAK